MPILITADFPTIDAENYKTTHAAVMGDGKPDGFIAHACLASGDGISVVDIWESQAHFDAFAQSKIGPTMADLGIEGGPENVTVTELLNADAYDFAGTILSD